MLDINLPLIQFNFDKTGHRNSVLSDFLRIKRTESSSHPIYVNQKKLFIWNQPWIAWYIVLFFTVNPGYDICHCVKVGSHKVDVERIILLQNPNTKEFEWVFFGAHSNPEGTWMKWQDCLFTETGALRVFVSPSSNAMYPAPKNYHRILGFANDDCTRCKVPWIPDPIDYVDAEYQSWSQSLGGSVVKGINAPNNVRPPPENSITDHQRLFLFLPQVRTQLQNGKQGTFF